MIAIASFRPLGFSDEWDTNQLAARQSWGQLFTKIIYLNDEDERMLGSDVRVTFLGGNEHPTIKSMCEIAAVQPEWSAIINADILVSPKFAAVEAVAKAKGARALVSYRYQFNEQGREQVTDNGLDFFAAVPALWLQASKIVPPDMRLGHPTWDTWMMGFLNHHAKRDFYDFTKSRCIFHPRHEGRSFVFKVDEGWMKQAKWWFGPPKQKIVV